MKQILGGNWDLRNGEGKWEKQKKGGTCENRSLRLKGVAATGRFGGGCDGRATC